MTNNGINSNLRVDGLRVRPYDLSSKVAHEKPGLDLFDDRSDFLLMAHQRYVAAVFCVINDNALRSPARRLNTTLIVQICDMTTGETVAAKSLKISFKASEICHTFRVDIMLEYSEVCAAHVYEVQVCEADTCHLLDRKEMRFFDMPRIRRVPTKWFQAVGAFAYDASDYDMTPMRGLCDVGPCGIGVRFHMNCDLDLDRERWPELEIRMIAPDGKVCSDYCRPQRDESSDGLAFVGCTFEIPEGKEGIYYVELRNVGYPFAGAVFRVGGEPVGGKWDALQTEYISDYDLKKGEARWGKMSEQVTAAADEFDKALDDFIADEPEVTGGMSDDIDDLIGLTSVKVRLAEYTQLARFSRLRERCGLPALSTPLHAMFLGSPGTGKTTVAKIIGRRLHDIGVLSKGHVVVRERSTLIGQFYSSESEKTLKALEEAKGGILFIDEAYQLYQPEDPKDPGRFVIETLMTALADESDRDWMLILAGYSEPMQAMFALNPGLRSRIPASNIYTFEDFTESELVAIAEGYFRRHRFELTPEARTSLTALLAHDYRNRGTDFGNARHVMNLIQTGIIPAMAMRLSHIDAPTVAQLSRIEAADIPAPRLCAPVSRPRIGFAV